MKKLKIKVESLGSMDSEKRKARVLVASKLKRESLLVREESMRVLKEFELSEDVDRE